MEVADQIAIIRNGRLEQVGTPSKCYDHPASEFVLTFLGPATQLEGEWVRPHDLVLTKVASPNSRRGTISRITQLGFEVRIEVDLRESTSTIVQVARRTFEELALAVDEEIFVSPHHNL